MWVLRSMPVQEPYDLGTDEVGRRVFIFDVDVYHQREDQEGRSPLVYAALGEHLRVELELEAGKTLFLGQRAELHDLHHGPLLRVHESIGFVAAVPTHQDLLAFRTSTVRVTAIGKDEISTAKLAHQAYEAAAFANQRIYARS